MRGVSGLLLIGIGVLHTAYGALQGKLLLAQIGRTTFATETGRQLVTGLGRDFVFWFLFGGFMMLALGHVLMWIERRLEHQLPAFVGWELLALSLVGLAFLPRSGFWLVLVLAIYVIVAGRRARAPSRATT